MNQRHIATCVLAIMLALMTTTPLAVAATTSGVGAASPPPAAPPELPPDILEALFGDDYILDPIPLHEYCTETRPGQNGRNDYYCCKHDRSGHHVCQWYTYECHYWKSGDTIYWGCAYMARGEDKQVYCGDPPRDARRGGAAT